MAVARMDKITLYAPSKRRKRVIELLQRCSSVEIAETALPDGFFNPKTGEAKALLEKSLATVREAISVLDAALPKQNTVFRSLYGKETMSYQNFLLLQKESHAIMGIAKNLMSKEKEKTNLRLLIAKRQAVIESLTPWENLDVSMCFEGTKKTTAFIGTLANAISYEELLLTYQAAFSPQQNIPPTEFFIINTSKEQTCIFVLCKKSDQKTVKQHLDQIGFSKPGVVTTMIPRERILRNENKIREAEAQIKELEAEIAAYKPGYQKLCFLEDCLRVRIEKYETLEKISRTKRIFAVTGYIPHEKAKPLLRDMEQLSAAVEIAPATDADDPPVMLKNSALAAPVETVLETYSMPGRGETDPTNIMAIFYYILFGLMLSDAGYGLVMVIACAFALFRFRNMESSLRKTLTMFLFCGISTTFWGVMFGSYFGDAVLVISSTFFHHPYEIPPLWFAPVTEPMRMLVFSMLLGVIHIFAGLGMKLYAAVRDHDYRGAVFDVICWYLVLAGGIVFLLSVPVFTAMTGLGFTLPPLWGRAAAWFAAVGALGVLFFAGRSTENKAIRFAKGLYALYGVTGYLSDILSYSRLLALGLATGVIAQVFNKMGSMFGDGALGIILFCAVFLIGHSLNMAINLLGAYVHTNRLQFVEFFGKFYQGGGRKYQPFGFHTKYYQFKEEKNHG